MAARSGRPYKLQVLSTNGERKLQGSANNPTVTGHILDNFGYYMHGKARCFTFHMYKK